MEQREIETESVNQSVTHRGSESESRSDDESDSGTWSSGDSGSGSWSSVRAGSCFWAGTGFWAEAEKPAVVMRKDRKEEGGRTTLQTKAVMNKSTIDR